MGALWASGSFQVRYAAGFAERELIREHWSPMSRVALMNYRGQQMYVIDNGSRSYYAPKNDETIRRYMRSLYTIPFQMKQGGDLLVIASGGGQELTMASHFGMKRIDAVEIARPMVTDIVRNKKDEPGNPYLLPNVHSHIADGRSVIMRSKHSYDVIEMLDVNFATVAGQISIAWSPNFISTQEAFSEYMEHLKEDGFLCYTLFSYSQEPPDRGEGTPAGEPRGRHEDGRNHATRRPAGHPFSALALRIPDDVYGQEDPVYEGRTDPHRQDRGLPQRQDRRSFIRTWKRSSESEEIRRLEEEKAQQSEELTCRR